jgi:ferredoxin
MNKTLTTSIVAISVAGAGAIGLGTLASAQYGGDDPTIDSTEDTTDDTTGDVADDVGPTGFQAAPDGEGPQNGERGRRGGRHNEAIAETLGITVDDLQAAREAGQTLAEVAEAQGMTADDVVAAIVADAEEHLAEEVAEGELTEDEAATRLAEITERATEKVNQVPGEGDRGSRGQRGFRGGNVETLTEALGVTTDDLQAAREAGQSIADVAEAQGVDIDTVVSAIVDDIEEHLADHVAEGDLTEDEAAERLAGATERVTEKVNQEPGEGDGFRGPRGPRGPQEEAPTTDA